MHHHEFPLSFVPGKFLDRFSARAIMQPTCCECACVESWFPVPDERRLPPAVYSCLRYTAVILSSGSPVICAVWKFLVGAGDLFRRRYPIVWGGAFVGARFVSSGISYYHTY